MDGYVFLHRKILESYHFANPDILKVWIWMLLRANHKDTFTSINTGLGFSDVELKRGQFIFGRTASAKELKMSESKIYRILKKLSSDNCIHVKSNNKYSIITICKFDDYNSTKKESEQLLNNNRTTTEQQLNTDNNDKNVNNVKKNIYRAFAHLKITKEEVQKLIEAGYSQKNIDDMIDRVENYKKNKDYKSLYLTVKAWLERNNPSTKEKRVEPYYEQP